MSPAVEQNIIKRMKKQNELILKPKMKGASMSRLNWKKKEASCGISTKTDSSKSTGKLSELTSKENSAGKNVDISPRLINRITPSPFEVETTGIRYVAYPIATTVPFNRTLSTSTPDPEKQATPKHVNTESVPPVHSISTQTLTEQHTKKPPTQLLTKIQASKLHHIIRNQTKAAQRKSTANSQFKPNKIISSSRQVPNKLKSKNESEVSHSNIPSYNADQNAVSFSIHQVNKVTSAGQKLVTSQNSAFHQVVCNVAQMQPPPSFNKDQYIYSHKMAEDPSAQQIRSKSPAFPGNTQNIPTNNAYVAQSSNTNLTTKIPDIQIDELKSIPNSTASQPFPLKDAVVSRDSPPFSSRYTTTSCPEAQFELYSQEERLPHTEQRIPSPQYTFAPTSTGNSIVTTTINRDGEAINSLINHFEPPEYNHTEFHPPYTQITSNHVFAPVDLPSRHESEGLVSFEEPVRDSDTQAKTKNLLEYPSQKLASLSKIPHMNVPETAATKRSEPSHVSDDMGIKTTAAADHFSSQNDYIQHPNSTTHNLPPLQWKSVEALAGAKTLRFMINELEEICKTPNQCEINRLVKQIQQVVNSLPQLSDTFDLQTEIGLSLQPLRNENSQLRRRLRIVSEEATQEKEKIEADQRRQTLELQLQLLNLEKRVDEEKLSKHQQLQQQEELVKELNLLKMERQSLVKDLGQRETSQFDLRRENWEENRKYLREMEIYKKEVEEKIVALEAAEKKNHILQITLEQRDMEISRMHEILLSAREGMKELIQNLCQSKDLTTPSEGIEKFFTFLTQDPTSECSSNLKIVSTGDSTATLTDSWTDTPASSDKGGSGPNIQKTALESSVDKRLQELLDTLKKGPREQETLAKGIEEPQTNSSVQNPPKSQRNSNKTKDYLGLQNQVMNPTSYLPSSDMKDSGCGASPDTENNLIPVFNDNHDQVRSNLNAFQVLSVSSVGTVAACSSPQENSADVTRASITDYFAKYPKAKLREQYCADGAESGRDQQERDVEEDGRGECLNAKQISNKIMQNILNKNQQFFTEAVSEFDVSSLSQYTVTTLSSLTGDVRTFRQGLASLDQNIARLQASIKTSKNTFST